MLPGVPALMSACVAPPRAVPNMSLFSRLFRPSPEPLASRPTLVVVGLGNPGARYAGSRHNAGFDVADRLALRLGAAWTRAGAAGLVAEGDWHGRRVALVKPQAFMNRSGTAVADVLRRTGVGPEALLVVTDDLALPVGQIRMRARGGAGGHNGLADIADALDSPEWARLRVGVGSGFAPGTQVEFVLAPFDAADRETADASYDRAAEAVLAVTTDGLARAMSLFNGRAPGA